MQDRTPHERRVFFRPYQGTRSNIYICTGCGMQFTAQNNMGELAIRFVEHLCEPVYVESQDQHAEFLTH